MSAAVALTAGLVGGGAAVFLMEAGDQELLAEDAATAALVAEGAVGPEALVNDPGVAEVTTDCAEKVAGGLSPDMLTCLGDMATTAANNASDYRFIGFLLLIGAAFGFAGAASSR